MAEDVKIKVSVIIPVYNVAQYLNECLGSVCRQSLPDIEIICIDDGSTDGSLSILEEYARKDSRVIVLRQANRGAAAARNAGLKIAAGEYIGFVDSDDWIDANYYETLYCAAKQQDADLARTLYKNCYPDRVQDDGFNSTVIKRKNSRALLGVNDHSVVIWNAIYRTAYLRRNHIGFDELKKVNGVSFTAKATFYSQKSIPVVGTYYYYRRGFQEQLSTFSPNRVQWICAANELTCRFINSVEYNNEMDYLTALKRCIWRYNDAFQKLIYYNCPEQKQLYEVLCATYNSCKYPDLLNSKFHEDYFQFLNGDYDAYYEYTYNKLIIPNLIISLTSYPARIATSHQCIDTLLKQTLKAREVVLWLAPEQFPNKEADLPEELMALTEQGLSIKWYHDIKPYKKLIPALKAYPNDIIVTADDDIYYPNTWLASLYKEYLENPKVVHGFRGRRISFDEEKLLAYCNWPLLQQEAGPANNILLTGAGGVLYPPNFFHRDIFNEKLFLKLCPIADDLWFWAMAVLNNTKIHVIKDSNTKLKYIEGTQDECLWIVNEDRNNIQFAALLKHYKSLFCKINRQYYPTTLERIFSVRKQRQHKVLRLCGLKIKYRRSLPLQQYLYSRKKEEGHTVVRFMGLKFMVKNKQKISNRAINRRIDAVLIDAQGKVSYLNRRLNENNHALLKDAQGKVSYLNRRINESSNAITRTFEKSVARSSNMLTTVFENRFNDILKDAQGKTHYLNTRLRESTATVTDKLDALNNETRQALAVQNTKFEAQFHELSELILHQIIAQEQTAQNLQQMVAAQQNLLTNLFETLKNENERHINQAASDTSNRIADLKAVILQSVQSNLQAIQTMQAVQNKMGEIDALKHMLVGLEPLKNKMSEIDAIKNMLVGLEPLKNKMGEIDAIKNMLAQLEPIGNKIGEIDTIKNMLAQLEPIGNKIGEIDTIKNMLGSIEPIKNKMGEFDAIKSKLEQIKDISVKLGDSRDKTLIDNRRKQPDRHLFPVILKNLTDIAQLKYAGKKAFSYDICLFTVPYWDYYSPFSAIPCLKSALGKQNIKSLNVDLNILMFLNLNQETLTAGVKYVTSEPFYNSHIKPSLNTTGDYDEYLRNINFIHYKTMPELKNIYSGLDSFQRSVLEKMFQYVYAYKGDDPLVEADFKLEKYISEQELLHFFETLEQFDLMPLILNMPKIAGISITSINQLPLACLLAKVIKILGLY